MVHVVGLCESYLTPDSKVGFLEIENYTAVHAVRSDCSGGGISIYVHDSVKLIGKLDSHFTSSFESCAVHLMFKGTPLLFGEFL